MASSSLAKFCLHCEDSSTDSLKKGWDLSTGKFAQLCGRCCSIYESGRFCETFHKKQGDWRNCQFCSKPIHCSCLVSFSEWLLLEGVAGKVICMECSKITSFVKRNFSNVMDLIKGIRSLQISKTPKCAIVSMFEKSLTAGDISNKDGSIVISKKHAEAYFPEISDPRGIGLLVVDDTGTDFKELYLRVRYWLNKMYVLDDLKEYMVSNNLQGGDTLSFSRVVPDGPYVMRFKKASTKKPSRKVSTRRRR